MPHCYVHAEDLGSALIGPFASEAEAREHIGFCEARGDGAEMRVIGEAEAQAARALGVGLEMTPAEDRQYVAPAALAG